MNVKLAPSIFESFNARALRPTQVAETFVPSQAFYQLCERRHSIVMGPRGSGKTTLLKMLLQPAIASWKHPTAASVRSSLDFTGVFVATDTSWQAQVESLGEGRLEARVHELLSRSVYTTHVQRSFVSAMISRTHQDEHSVAFRQVVMTDGEERKLVRAIADLWHLAVEAPSLLGLKHGLRRRQVELFALASRMASPHGPGSESLQDENLHLHFLESVAAAAEIFDDLVVGREEKWALLFDELELAPDWLSSELFRNLRSFDQRFLFKLAVSPFSETASSMEDPTGPAAGQDYDEIPLWYVERTSLASFCEQLFAGMLRERGLSERTAEQVLGGAVFDTSDDESKSRGAAYAPGSPLHEIFTRLATTDQTFADHLSRRSIDLNTMHVLGEEERAAEVRKISSLVIIREYFRSSDERQVDAQTRTRKKISLYAGADSLFAITEGNPRWFIGIVGRLLARWSDTTQPVPVSIQTEEIQRAAQRFSAMLRTIPVEGFSDWPRRRGVLGMMNSICDWFNKQIVRGDFNPDVPGSLTVDSQLPPVIMQMAGQALNAGALVYAPHKGEQYILRSLRGKRFRVSYLLGASYGLPLRLGRPIALSRVLREQAYLQDPMTDQLTLDGESKG